MPRAQRSLAQELPLGARSSPLGADHAINYREVEKWGEVALALTEGVGVDHVIEVGGPNTLAQSLIEANGIRPVIDRIFPLEELGDALRHQQAGQGFGKICLEI